ncbi:MAG: extracellular solute-binding protein [Oscillospiraceae bacterium]|nr:extracellular solute-binding protein [Oscillospiraceae bacterium]
MKILKITALLVCFAIIFVFLGCSGKTEDGDNDSGPTEKTKEAPDENADPCNTDYLPEYNLGGKDFNIIAYGTTDGIGLSYYWAESEIGESLNDSMYKRNIAVEERFSLKLNFTILKDGDLSGRITSSILSDDRQYDLFAIHPAQYAQTMLLNDYTVNWNNVASIDLEKPWWNQNIKKLLDINGYLPFMVSDFVFPSIIHTFMMVYNKNLQQSLGIESIYDLVDSGNWTFDKFCEIIRSVTLDLSGDGKMGVDDRYGYAASDVWHSTALAYGIGIQAIEQNENGYPEITLDKDGKPAKYLETMRELFNSKTIYKKDSAEIDLGIHNPISWDSDRIFIEATWLMKMPEMRNSESDYGIIPFPKWDANQKQYHTFTDGRGSALALPMYSEDLEMAGSVAEALSAESRRTVLPAYFDSTLNTKFARDEESIRMIQIILDGRVFDFGYMYRNPGEAITGCFQTLMGNSKSFAAHYESNYDMWRAHFDGIYGKYEELSQK